MFDEDKTAEAARLMLAAIGVNPEDQLMRDSPERIAKTYKDLLIGSQEDPEEPLATKYKEGSTGLVVAKSVTFMSLCEHHLMPFFGVAHIGYVPKGFVVGISKLVRTLDILAHRLQLQERITNQLADTIQNVLKPEGVGVVIEAEHMCMVARGIKRPGSKVITVEHRGLISSDANSRNEFMMAIRD